MKTGLRIDGSAWVALAALLCAGAVVVTAVSLQEGGAAGMASVASSIGSSGGSTAASAVASPVIESSASPATSGMAAPVTSTGASSVTESSASPATSDIVSPGASPSASPTASRDAAPVTSSGVSPSTSSITSRMALALDWQPGLGLGEPWRLWTGAWVHWSAAHLLVNAAGAAVLAFVGWRARLSAAAALAWFLAWPLTHAFMGAAGADRLAALMPHYGGLSGVLHAGAIVLGLTLAWPPERSRRRGPARPRVTLSPADTGFASTHASVIEPSRITEGPWAMTEMGSVTALPASTLDQPPAEPAATDDGSLRARWIGVAIVVGTFAKVALEAPWHLAPRPDAALGIAVAPVAHACGIAAGVLAWAAVRVVGGWRR